MVNKDGPTPLYLQVKESILERVEQHNLRPHDRVPSERELSQEFGISRMTARQALSEMVREGWLYVSMGKGTYVAERKLDQGLETLTGFTDDMRRRGLTASSRILQAAIIPCSLRLAEVLKIQPESAIVILERLRLADQVPLALETAHIPHHLCPGLLQYDLTTSSLYEIFRTKYGFRLGKAKETLEATMANDRERELLGLAGPGPVLLIERVTCLEDGPVIEYVKSAYRGDRYKFHTVLQHGS